MHFRLWFDSHLELICPYIAVERGATTVCRDSARYVSIHLRWKLTPVSCVERRGEGRIALLSDKEVLNWFN